MSVERRNILKAYGAELVLTEGAKGYEGQSLRQKNFTKEIPGSFIPGQFVNRLTRQYTKLLQVLKSGKIQMVR